MITVSRQQMIDFIFDQDPNKQTNRGHYMHKSGRECNCVMVDYGIKNKFDFSACTSQRWIKWDAEDSFKKIVAQLEVNTFFDNFYPTFCYDGYKESQDYTYGEVQEFLRDKGWEPSKS